MLNMRLLCLLCLVHIIQSGINAHSATKELLNKLIREYSKEIPKSVTIIQETTHTPRQKDSLTIPMLKFNVPLELYLWNSDVDSDFTVPQMGHRHEGKHNIIMTASVAQTLKVFDWIFSKRYKAHKTLSTYSKHIISWSKIGSRF